MTVIRRDGRIQSPFSEWVRNNPRLDSRNAGCANMDIDWIWHKYLVGEDRIGSREVNHIMVIEEKFGKDITFAQRDTMFLVHQALRLADGHKLKTARGDKVTVRFWGYFKLIEKDEVLNPDSKIWWNHKLIDLLTFEEILLFERNPITLIKRSDRRHHAKRILPLFDVTAGI